MSELIENKVNLGQVNTAAGTLSQDDVVQQKNACATDEQSRKDTMLDGEIPPKKRKTRRGKSKRRHPFMKNRIRKSVMKPEAPYNSNQFLLEDHGDIENLDENLKHIDRVSTSTITRTRDSSFSVDSDGEFYSSPDDEEEYLIKDFDDQYESLHVERLHSLSKDELIQEFLTLENRVETLSKRLRKKCDKDLEQVQEVESSVTVDVASSVNVEMQSELDRLTMENDALRRENEMLRNKVSLRCSSDSADSETDSSDSCSSSSSSNSSSSKSGSSVPAKSPKPIEEPEEVDYSQMNGQTPSSISSI